MQQHTAVHSLTVTARIGLLYEYSGRKSCGTTFAILCPPPGTYPRTSQVPGTWFELSRAVFICWAGVYRNGILDPSDALLFCMSRPCSYHSTYKPPSTIQYVLVLYSRMLCTGQDTLLYEIIVQAERTRAKRVQTYLPDYKHKGLLDSYKTSKCSLYLRTN